MAETAEEKKKRQDQLDALKANQTQVAVGTTSTEAYSTKGGAAAERRKTLNLPKAAKEVVEENPMAKAAREAKKRRDQAAAVAPKK